jgi:hypothetical protein
MYGNVKLQIIPDISAITSRRVPFANANSRMNAVIAPKHPPKTQPTDPALPVLAERLGDPTDPSDCHDFDLEVYRFMRSAERNNLPSPQLFLHQETITPRMRTTVLDWIVDVHRKMHLHTDTLYLTVLLIDQYLTATSIAKANFQRLACAALGIAAKSAENHPPRLTDLVELADKSFTVSALSRMEAELFATVQFHVDPILPSMFLKRFLRVVDADVELMMLAHFISETALLEAEFIGTVPSVMAAAVLCLALALLRGPNSWITSLVNNTGYGIDQLRDLVQKLLKAVGASGTGRCQAVRKKYGTEQSGRLSARRWPTTIELESTS